MRLAEPDQRLAALLAVCVAREFDCVRKEPHCLGRGEILKRLLPSPHRVVGRLCLVDRHGCQSPVQREFHQVRIRVLPIELLQCFSDAMVHARAARGTEPVIEGLVYERVDEAEAPNLLG